jgi:hypothetical protein
MWAYARTTYLGCLIVCWRASDRPYDLVIEDKLHEPDLSAELEWELSVVQLRMRDDDDGGGECQRSVLQASVRLTFLQVTSFCLQTECTSVDEYSLTRIDTRDEIVQHKETCAIAG